MTAMRDQRRLLGLRVKPRGGAANGLALAQKAGRQAYAKSGGATTALKDVVALYRARTAVSGE